MDSLKRLNADFALGLDFDKPIDSEAVKQRRAEQQLVKNFDAWEKWAFRVVCKHFHIIKDAMRILAPATPDDEPAPTWVWAQQNISRVEYWLDILTSGDNEDKIALYVSHRNEVKNIAETQRAICKNT